MPSCRRVHYCVWSCTPNRAPNPTALLSQSNTATLQTKKRMGTRKRNPSVPFFFYKRYDRHPHDHYRQTSRYLQLKKDFISRIDHTEQPIRYNHTYYFFNEVVFVFSNMSQPNNASSSNWVHESTDLCFAHALKFFATTVDYPRLTDVYV